jgi:acyl-coenzyme A thioesterase PaaI-like protein
VRKRGVLFPGKLNGVTPRRRRYDRGIINLTGKARLAMTHEDLTTDGWIHNPHEGFIELVGGLWERQQGESFQFGFLAAPAHQNRNGVVHGGMLMTFADRALGLTARRTSGAVRSATIQLSVQFLSPMRIGDFASIEPQALRLTKTIAFMSGAIRVRGETVASANGVWRLRRETAARD